MRPKKELGHEEKKGFTADVVVVGGGPGGAMAAKKCAERGMHTLLLEKGKLPHYKACSGFLISNLCLAIIDREFGVIPDWVLTDPPSIYYLSRGMSPTSYGAEPQVEPRLVLHGFRSDIDYWMDLKAKEAGAEIWDKVLVTDVIQENSGITLKIRRLEEEQEIRARFVVGADGTESITRKSLYPNLNVCYIPVLQEFYPGVLHPLDRKYAYTFEFDPPSKLDHFHVVHKKDCFHIDTCGLVMPVKEASSLAKRTLAKNFDFDPDREPDWSAGTVEATLLDDLFSGKFIPAKGNVLLVGCAAGLSTPSDVGKIAGSKGMGGEGINLAMKSGILAASAIAKAADTSQEAAAMYLTELQQVLSVLKKMDSALTYYKQSNWTQRNKLLGELI